MIKQIKSTNKYMELSQAKIIFIEPPLFPDYDINRLNGN